MPLNTTYTELVENLVNTLLEMTTTGSVGAVPTPMGGARGDDSDSKHVSTLGNNEMAAANAQTPAPVSDGQIAAQTFSKVPIPINKIKPKKWVGESKESVQDIASQVLSASDEDMEDPLKKNKPTELGSKLST